MKKLLLCLCLTIAFFAVRLPTIQAYNHSIIATNPSWIFYDKIWAHNTSGIYQNLSYSTIFVSKENEETVKFFAPLVTPFVYWVVKKGGTFTVTNQNNVSLTVSRYLTINETVVRLKPPSKLNDWQLGLMDTDQANCFTGFYVYYEYTGGSFNATLAQEGYGFTIWPGGWTTTNSAGNAFFMQISIAWGNVNSPNGYLALTNPVVSYGWAWSNSPSELSNPPVADITQNVNYELGIQYNSAAMEWQLYAYDSATNSFVLNEYVGYGSSGCLSIGNFGVIAEGSSNSSSQIPDSQQEFTNPAVAPTIYWYSWNSYSNGSPPINICGIGTSTSGYITYVMWCNGG